MSCKFVWVFASIYHANNRVVTHPDSTITTIVGGTTQLLYLQPQSTTKWLTAANNTLVPLCSQVDDRLFDHKYITLVSFGCSVLDKRNRLHLKKKSCSNIWCRVMTCMCVCVSVFWSQLRDHCMDLIH